MPNRQNKVIEGLVNPAVMGGFDLIMDQVTMDDGAVLTITWPAKTIFTVIVQTTGTSVAWTKDVSTTTGIGVVTFTATGDGLISFIISSSKNTTVAALDIGTDATYAMTPVR